MQAAQHNATVFNIRYLAKLTCVRRNGSPSVPLNFHRA
jgi:hypothetical protein